MNFIIEQIAQRLRERLPPGERKLAERFALLYFRHSAVEDLQEFGVDHLYGSVLSLWRLAAERQRGVPQIQVYNPEFDEQGWQSTHTVVEIVTDNVPFLVDSLTMQLAARGSTIHFMAHPVIAMVRGESGHLRNVLPPNGSAEETTFEAVMFFEIDRLNEKDELGALAEDVSRVLEDVHTVVSDWAPMRDRMLGIADTLQKQDLPVPAPEKEESIAFLQWLADNHFTFIGFRAYQLVTKKGEDQLKREADSGLGILRARKAARLSRSFANMSRMLRAQAREPTLLIVTKSSAVSTVHRPTHLDYVGIKRYDDAGEVFGEWRFLGLYGSLAYSERPANIPILRRKMAHVLETADYPPGSHSRKAIVNILDTFPRDEMFQFSASELCDVATRTLHIMEGHRLGLILRNDPFGRFVTALVYVPRDRYRTELRERILAILMEALDGESAEFSTQILGSPLARVHFIVRTKTNTIPEYNLAELQARLAEAVLSWEDGLRQALHQHFGEAEGVRLFRDFSHAFAASYQDDFPAHSAAADIERLLSITPEFPLVTHLYRIPEEDLGIVRFKVYGRHDPLALSDVLPMLERMGLRVLEARPYEIRPDGDTNCWILDFDMTTRSGSGIDVLAVKESFQEAFARVCTGLVENDGFNRLVLGAGLQWRQVTVLRALARYLVQTAMPFSLAYMEDTMAAHPEVARALVTLFETRFDPAVVGDVESKCDELSEMIQQSIDQVTSLDEDRILRQFHHLVLALLRTNYFQTAPNGGPKAYLSMKLDPGRVPYLPQPLPMYEIFVCSPQMEGVHLRGGPVARGGIRWSDRREDYRTEILGLMKAQMVKNAVIVPVGAKGGFVVKQTPPTPEDLSKAVGEAYRTLMHGLLDVTDNLVAGEVIPPPAVVLYDDDDPYLVVAADRGTATFSDAANAISEEYHFWLGDAFASGGSSGYDHKEMGITARGTWEAVKRHFRELGIDSEQDVISVIGIGDMSGDVFGNGMLMSQKIRLLAAFNHAHIFIDPDPDPATSYQERRRLFDLPKSSWEDYDGRLISAGGDIYRRSAKSVTLSAQARAALGTDQESIPPNELIRIILRAPVDLLWNGGIGTYVKAASESNHSVGDRSNDGVRIDARELRCRVVAEGGNLGFTQLGRVEYARQGGAINTDFIDNSGGVDCSDHEVNIKTLLGQVVAGGDMTVKQRDQLLETMTDEVAGLVLMHSYRQTQAISIAASQAPLLLSGDARLIHLLEKEGYLNRALEFLPDDEQLAERELQNEGLTRPEIAVCLAYSKIKLYRELLASDITDDPYLSAELRAYFPRPIQERFSEMMGAHPLRREIIATQITNSLINRMGGTFCLRLQDMTGVSSADIARCYTAAREIFRTHDLWRLIEALDGLVDARQQLTLMVKARQLLDQTTAWLLRCLPQPIDIETTISRHASTTALFEERLSRWLKGEARESLRHETRSLAKAGVGKDLALRVAALKFMDAALDITEVTAAIQGDIEEVARTYFSLDASLDIYWLRSCVQELPRGDLWQRKAHAGLLNDLQTAIRDITCQVLSTTTHIRGNAQKIAFWMDANRDHLDHCRAVFDEIRSSRAVELAMLTVAVREVQKAATPK